MRTAISPRLAMSTRLRTRRRSLAIGRPRGRPPVEERPHAAPGLRRSPGAARWSPPSGLRRRAGGRPATCAISAFAAETAPGADVTSSRTYRSLVVSRSASEQTACTRPISRARAAAKRAPVRNSSRAADVPIFATTKGEITAGRMPSLASVKPNCAVSVATTMSQTAARPAPPPRAAPWMRPISGIGSVSSAWNIAAIALASRTFSS